MAPARPDFSAPPPNRGSRHAPTARFLLARALVGAPSVLLLDEATRVLDPTTEADETAAVAELQATRIVVAHRLSTILCADQVLLLRDGRLHSIATRHPRPATFTVSPRSSSRAPATISNPAPFSPRKESDHD